MSSRSGMVKLGLIGAGVVVLVGVELAAIIWVAGQIGWWTLALLLTTTVLGLILLQREWKKAWGVLAETIRSGQLPTGRLADATLILVGGVLLVTPGLITDLLGLLLLLPFTRPFVRSALTWLASRSIRVDASTDGGVVEGEVLAGSGDRSTETLIPSIQPETETIRGEVLREDPRPADRDGLVQ